MGGIRNQISIRTLVIHFCVRKVHGSCFSATFFFTLFAWPKCGKRNVNIEKRFFTHYVMIDRLTTNYVYFSNLIIFLFNLCIVIVVVCYCWWSPLLHRAPFNDVRFFLLLLLRSIACSIHISFLMIIHIWYIYFQVSF